MVETQLPPLDEAYYASLRHAANLVWLHTAMKNAQGPTTIVLGDQHHSSREGKFFTLYLDPQKRTLLFNQEDGNFPGFLYNHPSTDPYEVKLLADYLLEMGIDPRTLYIEKIFPPLIRPRS